MQLLPVLLFTFGFGQSFIPVKFLNLRLDSYGFQTTFYCVFCLFVCWLLFLSLSLTILSHIKDDDFHFYSLLFTYLYIWFIYFIASKSIQDFSCFIYILQHTSLPLKKSQKCENATVEVRAGIPGLKKKQKLS